MASTDELVEMATSDWTRTISAVLLLMSLYLLVSELIIAKRTGKPTDNAILGGILLLGSITTLVFGDVLLGVLAAVSVLMIHQTWALRGSPVWRELLVSSSVTYFMIMIGQFLTVWFDDDRYFGIAYTASIYVFLILCFIFFGRRFILVSRFMSPQILYVSLFIVAYVAIYQFDLKDHRYIPGLPDWSDRVLFATFGTYESLLLASFAIYLISGWVLNVLFSIKPVTDPRVVKLVDEVKGRLGIKRKVKIGHAPAPILNAMAYGPFYDLRIAFISNSMDEFTDDDIRGIAAHELAHSSKHHIPYLLGLTALELAIKKAFGLPASQLDYAWESNVGISFLAYFLYSYGIMIILLVFVRILEGHADETTLKAGYGKELARALYKLDAFYRGVAGDFGMSVNLLTNKQYTESERHRYAGDSAVELLTYIRSPGTMSLIGNILMSHPKTAFRLAYLTSEDLRPRRGAFLPYLMLIPFIRKKWKKRLASTEPMIREIVDAEYINSFGTDAIERYTKVSGLEHYSRRYVSQTVIGFRPLTKTLSIGSCTAVEATDSVTAPLRLKLENATEWTTSDIELKFNGKTPELAGDGDSGRVLEEAFIELNSTDIGIIEPNALHVLKNGRYCTLTGIQMKKGRTKFVLEYQKAGSSKTKLITTKNGGYPLNYVKSMIPGDLPIQIRGLVRHAVVGSVDMSDDLKKAELSLTVDEEQLQVKGSDFVWEIPPVGFLIRAGRQEEQRALFEWLVGRQIDLFTKDDLEMGIPGVIRAVNKDSLTFDSPEGETDTKLARVDYVVLLEPILKLIDKKEIGPLDRMSIWWSNRHETHYLVAK